MLHLPIDNNFASAHYVTLKDDIIKRIESLLNGSKHRVNKKKYKYKKKELDCLRFIKQERILKILITSNSTRFPQIIRLFRNYEAKIDEEKNQLNRVLYNLFIKSIYETSKFNNWAFIKQLDIKACPYCNRSYIYTINEDHNVKPEIDHFYPKSKYPYLGLSFFNLIPSCPTCNGKTVKSNKDPLFEHFKSPYEINEDDFKFSIGIESITAFDKNPHPESIKIKLNDKTKLPDGTKGNSNLFRLEELYKHHTDHIQELIIASKYLYDEASRENLKVISGNIFTDNDIDRFIVRNYTNLGDNHKRPLSKMYTDISKELGLIK